MEEELLLLVHGDIAVTERLPARDRDGGGRETAVLDDVDEMLSGTLVRFHNKEERLGHIVPRSDAKIAVNVIRVSANFVIRHAAESPLRMIFVRVKLGKIETGILAMVALLLEAVVISSQIEAAQVGNAIRLEAHRRSHLHLLDDDGNHGEQHPD